MPFPLPLSGPGPLAIQPGGPFGNPVGGGFPGGFIGVGVSGTNPPGPPTFAVSQKVICSTKALINPGVLATGRRPDRVGS